MRLRECFDMTFNFLHVCIIYFDHDAERNLLAVAASLAKTSKLICTISVNLNHTLC